MDRREITEEPEHPVRGTCSTPRRSSEPVWARFFDFGAGRMPAFLTKLACNAP